MVRHLQDSGWQVDRDSFVASTPLGDLPMTNLIGKLPGTRPEVVNCGASSFAKL